MTHTLVDCACEARVHADGSGVEIDFCPLHEAAPELLAALKHMEACASCAQADWSACPGGREALAAIAKAEGR